MPNTCKSSEVAAVAIQYVLSGRRVSNTYTIYLLEGDSPPKGGVIPRKIFLGHLRNMKHPQGWLRERSASYQLVGEVMAHQGYDGYPT